MGPLVAGLLYNFTGSMRPAFLYLAIMVSIPIWMLRDVDVALGKKEARSLVLQMKFRRRKSVSDAKLRAHR